MALDAFFFLLTAGDALSTSYAKPKWLKNKTILNN